MDPKIFKKNLRGLGMLLSILPLHPLALADDATAAKYVITNDNKNPNTATFYKIGGTQTAPTLTLLVAAGTGGDGASGWGSVSVAKVANQACAYVSNRDSENITAIVIGRQKYVGIYAASATDSGLAVTATNGAYLYAAYNSSGTIATFQVSAGCKLTFVGDVPAYGLNDFVGANGINMALHGSMLVVAYSEGSIESFNISSGLPVSNGDKQNASGYSEGFYPVGVDVSKNGQYAVFGDDSGNNAGPTAIEVSNISSGKLTPTVLYDNLGASTGSRNVLLSPGGSLLYISDVGSYQLTAAKFNETTGRVSKGCLSAVLNGGSFPLSLALASTSGTGGVLYVAEFSFYGGASSIGMLSVSASATQCTLTEPTNSPVYDPDGYDLRSIAVWPPRPF
jgi:6-phosphogluconolactonase (cycloisomerase 2 family)